MAIRSVIGEVQDKIPVNTVLVSVYDKTGLSEFVTGLSNINPNVQFISTGGTYKTIEKALSEKGNGKLVDVAEFTGTPEMEGGLVKTLDPKIHAGILAERSNEEHKKYLELIEGKLIDMVVCNLYPFKEVISQGDVSFETSRGHIDIGGPTMLRGAAKNFLGCAAVSDPLQYNHILEHLLYNGRCTTLEKRIGLSQNAFTITSQYETDINNYLRRLNPKKVAKTYLEKRTP